MTFLLGAKEVISRQDDIESIDSSPFDDDLVDDVAWEEQAINRRGTRAVSGLRIMVLLVLVGSAIGVALSAFFYISGNEESQFEAQFKDESNKIMDAIGSSLSKTLTLFDGLAATLVSSARAANESWPFVTLPDFGLRLSKILPLSDAFLITVLPLVAPKNRKEWEDFSLDNDYWVNETIAFQETWGGYYGPVVEEWERIGVVHGDYGDIPANISRPMLPQWQTFPSIPTFSSAYNWDWLSASGPETLYTCIDKQRTVISEPYMIPKPNDPVSQEETMMWAEWHRDYLPRSEEPIEPVSDIYYPIVKTWQRGDTVFGNSGNVTSNDEVVGVIAAAFYWRAMIRNILPKGSNGLVLVVENSCTMSFTYQINGPTVKYLGVGDNHDAKYDALVKVSKQSDLQTSHQTVYFGAAVDSNVCPYTFRIYPSNDMKSAYTTNNPVIFMISAIAIFAFTSVVFFFYDRTVEQRQRNVASTAANSSAIVSSLFPASVRDRLYPAIETRGKKTTSMLDNRIRETQTGIPLSGRPIAELYPETTVFFADIVGFTAWSASRQPTEVFHLLETIYAVFDEIAHRRRVFKIETIGDCYVAVVGLPSPRTQHAVVMARFADECRTRMAEVTLHLEERLGSGTADLALRIGINSGPTTGGVLRGTKSRFQLFGDTVNTASRMESNGARNKIHVSKSTAEHIIQSGKGHWLTPRLGEVDVKGKGRMDTYWCEPNACSNGASETNE